MPAGSLPDSLLPIALIGGLRDPLAMVQVDDFPYDAAITFVERLPADRNRALQASRLATNNARQHPTRDGQRPTHRDKQRNARFAQRPPRRNQPQRAYYAPSTRPRNQNAYGTANNASAPFVPDAGTYNALTNVPDLGSEDEQ